MNDFETKLKTLLNEQVDAEVGRRRTPPPFEPPSAAERANRRWFDNNRTWALPLLAAACVAAIVGTTLGASNLLAADKQVPPGTAPTLPSVLPSLTATPTPTSAATTLTSAPSPTTTASTPNGEESTVESPPPDYQMVPVGAANIAVPAGWTLEEGQPDSWGTGWCLYPNNVDPANADIGCPIHLHDLSAFAGSKPDLYIDADNESFGTGDPPQYCSPDHAVIDEQTGDRAFGGRTADWRLFDRTCPNGDTYESEQYLVATNPAYGMFAWQSDARTHAAMTVIAEYSTLPTQVDPLRLADRGILTDVESGPDSVTITLDRVVATTDGTRRIIINRNPTAYTYVMPAAVYDDAGVSVGDRVLVQSNGQQVTRVLKDQY